jgi:hypothetical protein
MAITAPDVIRTSGPAIENFGASGLSKASVAPLHDLAEVGAAPPGLQKEIVNPPQRQQPALDGVLGMFGAGHVAQALRCNGAHGRKRVLDAVVQLFQDQLLQLVGCLALLGVYSGLGQQFPGVDFGLCQQQPQADVLSRQEVLERHSGTLRLKLVQLIVGFKHGHRITISRVPRT